MKLQGKVNITYTTKVYFFYIIDSGITILLYIFFLKKCRMRIYNILCNKIKSNLSCIFFFLEKNRKICNQNGVVISLCNKKSEEKKNDGGCFKFKL